MVSKNKKLKVSKKWPTITCILIILLGVCIFAAHSLSRWPFDSSTDTTDPNAQHQQTVNTSPKNSNPAKTTPADDYGNKTSDQIPDSTALTATITEVSQSGDTVRFSAQVANSSTAGTCVVTFTNANDRPVTKQVDATYKAGTSQCGPLNIPAYEFSYLGNWDVTLHYYENSQQATATSKVTIQ